MPEQKSNVQTALKKHIVLNGFANEENALPQAHHCALPQSLMSLFKIAFQPKIRMGTRWFPTKTQTSSQVTPGTAAGLMEAPLQRRRSPRGLRRITPGLVQRAATFQALTRQGLGQALLGLGKKLRKDMAR
jgi:hypothetical protein